MKKNQIFCAAAMVALASGFMIYFLRKKKLPRQLIIIGNGFDIYHGIPSGYLQFREYLRHQDSEVFDTLEKYLSLTGDDEWNQLERNLANLDAEELLDEMGIYHGDASSDEWSDSMYHDFQYEVGQVTRRLGEEMKEHFRNWILQLDTRYQSSSPKLFLPLNNIYLNFNYTNSLEVIYGISEKNIYYIHGKALDNSSELVLGHGWEFYADATIDPPFTMQDYLEGNFPASEEDWQYTEAKEYIENYFSSTFKDASQIIRYNKNFYNKLKRVQHIYVMGHSMSRVDSKYFEAIARNIDVKIVKWTVSYYSNGDIKNATETLMFAGVDMNLVTFKRLGDFFSNQIALF